MARPIRTVKVKSIALLSFLLIGCLRCIAIPQQEEKPILNVDFTVYSLQRHEGLKFLTGDRLGSTEIEFFSSARSQVYEYEGLNPIIFFREIPDPKPEFPDRVKRIKVAEATVPQTGGEFLFIFFENKAAEREAYRIYPLEDSTRTLPYGSIRLFNATPYTVKGLVGRTKVMLRTGPSEAFRHSGNQVSVGLGFSHEGTFYQSFNSPLQCSSNERGLLMLFPPHVKGSAFLQTRFLRESAPEEETDTTINTTNAE